MNAKLNRSELMGKVMEIIRSNTNDPADELVTLGKAIMEIGETLRGRSPQDAKAVLHSAARLLDVA